MAHLPAVLPLYYEAYRRLNTVEPIAADCGALCGRRCCQGDDSRGMLLFPHEELLLSREGYALSERSMQGRRVLFAVCTGRCRRPYRPLACKIYPFAPMLQNGEVTVGPDPRAKPFCPLLRPEAAPYIQPAFLDTLQDVFARLSESPVGARLLADYTRMLQEYQRFTL